MLKNCCNILPKEKEIAAADKLANIISKTFLFIEIPENNATKTPTKDKTNKAKKNDAVKA